MRPAQAYIDAVRAHEPAATREVAETVGVTRQGALYRLRVLEDDGQVRSKRVGRELVWFASENGDDV